MILKLSNETIAPYSVTSSEAYSIPVNILTHFSGLLCMTYPPVHLSKSSKTKEYNPYSPAPPPIHAIEHLTADRGLELQCYCEIVG